MIKFFRNIRQHMIKENKVSKYLLYAIGEIILVVIGILIALQVNNWNIERKQHQLEKVLLAQVREEILTVKLDLENDLNLFTVSTESYFKVLDYIQRNVTYADSMCFDFYFLKQDEYIVPKQAVYDKIKLEGIDIIRNDTISELLQRIYEAHFPRLTKDHAFYPNLDVFFTDYYKEHFRPNTDFSLKYFREIANDTIFYPRRLFVFGDRLHTIGYVPLDFEALKQDHEFQMLLDVSKEYRRHKLARYRRAKRDIDRIIPLIDKELAND